MKKTQLLDGEDSKDGVFNTELLYENEVDPMQVMNAVVAALQPFAPFLKKDHGFGVSVDDEGAHVIGFTTLDD